MILIYPWKLSFIDETLLAKRNPWLLYCNFFIRRKPDFHSNQFSNTFGSAKGFFRMEWTFHSNEMVAPFEWNAVL